MFTEKKSQDKNKRLLLVHTLAENTLFILNYIQKETTLPTDPVQLPVSSSNVPQTKPLSEIEILWDHRCINEMKSLK